MFVAPMLKMGRNARKAIAASGATLAASQSEDADAGLTGFFSQAVKAAKNLTRKTGNAQGFKNDLTGKGQVKPDELKAMGFDEHFGDRTDITKEEVQQFINDNQVQIKEVTKGQVSLPSPYPNHNTSKFGKWTLDEGESGENYRELLLQDNSSARLLDELNSLNSQMGEIKTPLLRNVTSDDALKKRYSDATIFGDMEIDEFVANEIPEYAALLSRRDELVKQKDNLPEPFINSGHFDEPNIFAHLRMKDRVDADGNKTLLLEEVQSDWHQTGANQGYKGGSEAISEATRKVNEAKIASDKAEQEMADYFKRNGLDMESEVFDTDLYLDLLETDEASKIMDSQADAMSNVDAANRNLVAAEKAAKTGVPDAPFKTDDKSSWYNLAMKRGLIEAAEGDYDKLAITTGRQQAERYDLSKTIGSLKYQEDMVEGRPVNILTAYDKHGMRVFNRRVDDPEKDLPSIIGKDATKSLLEAEPYTPPQETRSIRSLRGQELNVGGEGMKEFYDRKLPNTLNKLVKQDGVKVGQTTLDHPHDGTGLNWDGFTRQEVSEIERLQDLVDRGRASEIDREYLANYLAREKPYGDTVHSIDITPEMRERVKKGLPLFSHPAVGAVTLAGGAALGSGALVDMPSAEMPKYTSLYDDSVSVGNTMGQELAQQKANMSEEELSDYNFNNLMAEEARMRELGSLSYGKASPELMAYRRRNILPSLEEVGNQIKLNAASYLDAISSGNMSYTGLPDYEFSRALGIVDSLPKYREPTVRKAVEPMLKEYIDPRDKRSLKDAKNIADMVF